MLCKQECKISDGRYKVENDMRKPAKKSSKKMKKNDFEERFAFMVGEYQKAKEVLDSMEEGTSEYVTQKKTCDRLFANAERYINKN